MEQKNITMEDALTQIAELSKRATDSNEQVNQITRDAKRAIDAAKAVIAPEMQNLGEITDELDNATNEAEEEITAIVVEASQALESNAAEMDIDLKDET